MKKVTQYLYVYMFLGMICFGFVVNVPTLRDAVKEAVAEYSYEGWSIVIGNEYTEHIWNRYAFVEGNGMLHRILGQNRMNGVVKLDSGELVTTVEQRDVAQQAQSVVQLQEWLEGQDIEFLYVNTPYEICDTDNRLPVGIEDYSNDNANRFVALLQQAEVPCLNLHDVMHEEGMNHYDAFFKTDHHWTIETAFWAFTQIVKYTEEELNMCVPEEYLSLDSYVQTEIEEIILGSNGRKTGYLYGGLDSMTTIVPVFDTSVRMIVEEQQMIREGSFEEAFMFYDRMTGTDIYETAQYDVYMGQDYGLCSLQNTDAVCEQKILLIKDSYSRPVMAFMGTVYSQVDVIDMRYYQGNVYEYIEEENPDMVIIIYNPYMLNEVGNFNFENEGDL